MDVRDFLAKLQEQRERLIWRPVRRAKVRRSLVAKTVVLSFSSALSSSSFSLSPIGKSVAVAAASMAAGVFLLSLTSVGSMQNQIIQMNNKMSLLEHSYFALMDENQKLRARLKEIEEDRARMEKRLQQFSSVQLRDRRIAMENSLKTFFLQKIPSGRPIHGAIVSDFGMRYHPIFKRRIFHEGVDISAPVGTAVVSTADGVVRKVGWESGYGNIVVIDHMHGFQTLYAHLSRIKVKAGERVKKGQTVALSGNTGISTGPHLHYEVRYRGSILDPVNFITWSSGNYESIFQKEGRVSWGYLIEKTKQYQPKVALRSSPSGFRSRVN
ncbi:MAG: M23 family metallopeptidase [Campylobacterales bacterium]